MLLFNQAVWTEVIGHETLDPETQAGVSYIYIYSTQHCWERTQHRTKPEGGGQGHNRHDGFPSGRS